MRFVKKEFKNYKKAFCLLLAAIQITTVMFYTSTTAAHAEDARQQPAPPNPAGYQPGRAGGAVTAFGEGFIEACEGQQWLLDETERLLNIKQSSIDYLSPESLRDITSIGLGGKGVEGKIPRAIGYFHNLEYLLMPGNKLSGDLPEELYGLAKLKNIDLSDNLYEGPLPTGFGKLPALEVLRLSGNSYSGSIPKETGDIAALRVLDLSHNRLTGGMAPELGRLENLQLLDLSGNPLGGGIPEEIYGLGSLEVLLCWNSGLSGGISPNIKNLKSLKYLDLAENSLDGPIPEGIGGLAALRELTLSHNLLTGYVPDAFGQLKDLMEAHIDHNYLRGHLPESLHARFVSGASVTFAQNYMTGPLALDVDASTPGGQAGKGNFTDGARSQQYRLTGPGRLYFETTGKAIDVLPLLRNINVSATGAPPKPMRPADEYEIEVIPPGLAGLVDARVASGGIHVALLGKLPYASGAAITVMIKGNTGSEYSKCAIRLTTDKPPAPSGGSGGGAYHEVQEPGAPLAAWHTPYIKGYEDGGARPDGKISREEAAVVLYRLSGGTEPATPPALAPFTDVAPAGWSAAYIEHVRKNKLMVGYPDGGFRPEDPISRNEFAALLCRFTGVKALAAGAGELPFKDAPAAWARGYVAAAWQAGHINGYPDGTFRGEDGITRAEAVRMMNGALARKPDKSQWGGAANPYNDISESHWAYHDILEASVSHAHLPGAGDGQEAAGDGGAATPGGIRTENEGAAARKYK